MSGCCWVPICRDLGGFRPPRLPRRGELVTDRWNGGVCGEFGVDLPLLLQHGGAGSWWPQPWNPVPAQWVEGEDRHPGGVCPNVGDIPVVSFPHGDSSRNCPDPQQPPPSRLISHFQTFNFLIKTCPWSGTDLLQVAAVAGGGRWAHLPSPQSRGPLSRRGEGSLAGVRSHIGAVPHSASSHGEQDPDATRPFCPLQVPWRCARPCCCCWC